MDINTIVLIIILAVILYAMVTNNQSKSKKAEELREQIIAEKETISKEEVATYGQVQDRKNQLIKVIELQKILIDFYSLRTLFLGRLYLYFDLKPTNK